MRINNNAGIKNSFEMNKASFFFSFKIREKKFARNMTNVEVIIKKESIAQKYVEYDNIMKKREVKNIFLLNVFLELIFNNIKKRMLK